MNTTTNHLTAISDADKKWDIIDHVNQDHNEALVMIAQNYNADKAIDHVEIRDIFHEGVMLDITYEANGPIHEVFIAFELKGELEEQILYLAYHAHLKQNKVLLSSGKRYFEVLGTAQLTPNFTRITIGAFSPLPDDFAGYAYGFFLNVMERMPTSHDQRSRFRWLKNRYERLFLWVMKQLSSKNRRRLMGSMSKNTRIYTLRDVYKVPETAEFNNRGLIDVFTHNHSTGSLWVTSLKVGDIISSHNGADDKHEHLAKGQAVLIADEAAYPAMAGILANWRNDQSPHVIILSRLDEEQAYFDEVVVPVDVRLYRLIGCVEQQGEKVVEILDTIEPIDNVWGALEVGVAKVIRHYLRNQRDLKGKNNRVKGYWRLKSED